MLVAEVCVERGERRLDVRFELCGHIVLCMNLKQVVDDVSPQLNHLLL